MLDIQYLRSHRQESKKKITDRGFDASVIDEALKLDEERLALLQRVEDLRSQRNLAAKSRDVEKGRSLKEELDQAEVKLVNLSSELDDKMRLLPNLILDEVPVGEPDQGKVIESFGEPKKFDFEPKDHLELGEKLDIIDTQTAAKVSGSRFAYLKNGAARLELALFTMAWDRLIAKGFSPVIPPALIRKDITTKLGYWQGGGNENYYLVCDLEDLDGQKNPNQLYLIGTGEHALVPMHENDLLPKEALPKRYVAFSSCFRREAGTYGKDTRGIFRVHQFDKVEMVSFCRPEEAIEEFNLLLTSSWQMMKDLGLPVRQVMLASKDISFPSAKTVDIETWFPSQGAYRETHSISTTTDFQSRRLNTRFIADGKNQYVHILNGTAFAIGRTIAAIMDNYQRADGSIEIPEALRKYTGFNEIRVG